MFDMFVLDKTVLVRLKTMRAENRSVADMLRSVKASHEGDDRIVLLCIQYFGEAFDLSFRDVSSIPGWEGFGGELTDKIINDYIEPLIYKGR